MWKCSKCQTITKGSIYATDGYCKICKEYHLLGRYDPLNPEMFREGKD